LGGFFAGKHWVFAKFSKSPKAERGDCESNLLFSFAVTAALKSLPALAAATAAASTSRVTASTTTGLPATTVPTSASAFTSRLWPRFIHVQNSPVHFGPVQMCNSCLRFTCVAHFNKCKATGLTGVTIGHYVHAFYSAVLCESGVELVLSRSITEIPYKNIGHSISFFF